MTCTMCNLAMDLGIEVVRAVKDQAPQKRLICFPCLTVEAERIMRPRMHACPICKTPPTGEERDAVREFLVCANGHKW